MNAEVQLQRRGIYYAIEETQKKIVVSAVFHKSENQQKWSER